MRVFRDGPIAQSAERCSYKADVTGSSPVRTIFFEFKSLHWV